MAVMNQTEVEPEEDETRQGIIARALVSNAPSIPGVNAVRGMAPLVMVALQRANNPYVTAKAGFDAMGIALGDDATKLDPAAFGVAMMPKTAEVLVLFSCDREALKRYAVDSAALEDAAMNLMDGMTMDDLATATLFVSEELVAISKTRAGKAPEEKANPEAEPLKGDGKHRPKKHVPTGSRKS